MTEQTSTHTPGEIEQTTIGSVRAWRVYDENGKPWQTTTNYDAACAMSASLLGEAPEDDEGYCLDQHEADERAMLQVI
jgi:hypothetical protein